MLMIFEIPLPKLQIKYPGGCISVLCRKSPGEEIRICKHIVA